MLLRNTPVDLICLFWMTNWRIVLRRFYSELLSPISVNRSGSEFNPFPCVAARSKRRIHPVTQQLSVSSIMVEDHPPVLVAPEFPPHKEICRLISRAVSMAVPKHSRHWYHRSSIVIDSWRRERLPESLDCRLLSSRWLWSEWCSSVGCAATFWIQICFYTISGGW
jgi:hypothetical protein